MQKIGIDVRKVSTQACVLTEDGETRRYGCAPSESRSRRFSRARPKARVQLEAATESEWVARHLESLGHEVIVADPGYAPTYASRSRKVKTDKRDARALCDACHLGVYRPAHRSIMAGVDIKAHLIEVGAPAEQILKTASTTWALRTSSWAAEGDRR